MWRAALATLPVLAVTAYLFAESRHSERLLLEAETARQADNTFLQFQEFATTHLGILQDAGNFVLTTPSTVAEGAFVPFVKRLALEKTDFYSVVWKQADGTIHEIAPLQSGPSVPRCFSYRTSHRSRVPGEIYSTPGGNRWLCADARH